ncbi:MAG: DsbC family protein [Nitrospirae bacterium]|nr:DsbC family protein [Nitrospirota bacterium]
MNKVLFSLLVCVMLLPVAYARAADTKCETLTKDEAAALVKLLNPNLRVLDVESSPVQGIWEVTITSGGQKGLFYIDCSKRYIILGDLIDTKARSNLTRERMAEINKVDVASIPLDDAIVIGDKSAPHMLIVFDDPDCPYCAQLHQEIKQVVEKRKDIVFFIKMFPLAMHKGAYDKAKAIVCGKSLKLLDDAFEKKDIPAAKCATSAVDDNIKLGGKLGIQGTPAIIFPDGRVLSGSMPADALIQEVDKK